MNIFGSSITFVGALLDYDPDALHVADILPSLPEIEQLARCTGTQLNLVRSSLEQKPDGRVNDQGRPASLSFDGKSVHEIARQAEVQPSALYRFIHSNPKAGYEEIQAFIEAYKASRAVLKLMCPNEHPKSSCSGYDKETLLRIAKETGIGIATLRARLRRDPQISYDALSCPIKQAINDKPASQPAETVIVTKNKVHRRPKKRSKATKESCQSKEPAAAVEGEIPAMIKEMIGKRFGLLQVTGFAGRNTSGSLLLQCLCACGKRSKVSRTNLMSGNTTSCGQSPCRHRHVFVDLTGRTFGLLTVTGFAGRQNNTPHWHVRCRCGRVCTRSAPCLREEKSDRVLSCGCLRHNQREHKLSARLGLTFGDWTVIALLKRPDGYSDYDFVRCRCVCGKEKNVRYANMFRGSSRGCGCARTKNFHNSKKEPNQ